MPRFANFPQGITSLGVPVFGTPGVNGGGPIVTVGPTAGYNATKISTAITLLGGLPGGTIAVYPGTYDDYFTISLASTTIIGMGPPRSVIIAPTTSPTSTACTVSGQFCQLSNLDISAGVGSTRGTLVNADSFRAFGCKFEAQDNTAIALDLLPSAVSGLTASLGWVEDCEIAWTTKGVRTNLATSAVTEFTFKNCLFHNCSAYAIGEDSAGTVRDLTVDSCTFLRMQDGTEPTAYITLNSGGGNLNTGIVTASRFPTALAGGKNSVSTLLLWAANYMTDGISNAQPS